MIEGRKLHMGKFLYYLIKGTAYLLLKLFFRLQVEGKENIPPEGPVIAAANHVSILDPPALSGCIDRQIYYMAKEELFKNPLLGWVLRTIGTFPVKRGIGDREAIKKALSVLKEGNVLGMFPEGTRKSGEVQMGIVMMAYRTGAPILPIALFNTDRKKNSGPIRVIIGKPFYLDIGDKKPSQEERRELAERVMEAIKELS